MWVARDKHGHTLLFIKHKPFRDDNDGMWVAREQEIYLEYNMFPNLTWKDEPLEVSLVPTKDIENFINENNSSFEEYKKEVIAADISNKAEGIF